MNGQDKGTNPMDPFTAFWSDWMAKMPGVNPPASSGTPDVLKQMRQAFFDAMAQYADQFMRSEQFLNATKQAMENALAFRQQIDQFLTQSVRNMQAPARADTDHILIVLRSMEERVLNRLEQLDQRVSELENEKAKSKRVAGKKQ